MFKIKLNKTVLFVLLLGVLALASLGFTVKEAFDSKINSNVDSRGNRVDRALEEGGNFDPFMDNTAQSALPKGIPKSDIGEGEEDLYILKSEVVPPVCPKCPDTRACP